MLFPTSKHEQELKRIEEGFFDKCKKKRRYPPRAYGHWYCKTPILRVPRDMGWHWNINLEKSRRGWRPGAIHRKTKRIMDYFRQQKAQAKAEVKRRQFEEEAAKEQAKPKPTQLPRLHIKKEKGQYRITLFPLFDPNLPASQVTDRMKPIEFTIAKSDAAIRRHQVKQFLEVAKDLNSANCVGEGNEEFNIAMEDINEFLQNDGLRHILQSDSESESSIDIEIGGGILRKVPSKANVGIQIDGDL